MCILPWVKERDEETSKLIIYSTKDIFHAHTQRESEILRFFASAKSSPNVSNGTSVNVSRGGCVCLLFDLGRQCAYQAQPFDLFIQCNNVNYYANKLCYATRLLLVFAVCVRCVCVCYVRISNASAEITMVSQFSKWLECKPNSHWICQKFGQFSLKHRPI